MFSVSDLNEEQVKQIHSWVEEGAQMADVQKRLESEFGHIVTYMDTRFLSLDLGLEFQVEEELEPEVVPEVEIKESEPGGETGPAGDISVSIHEDPLQGSVISGAVVFSDGQGGQWMIDQEGRLAMDPDTQGYQPSEADVVEFQEKLREAVESQG
tara:strand:- start:9 stop:473 length:465 start_codon:yes stop_codon:yes gene_type:complete